MNPSRPARPIGLIFAAIILGLFALGALLCGAFTLIAVFTIPQHALATAPGAAPAPSPRVLEIMIGAVALFELLIAAFGIWTIVGLVRLKNWARFSILVIGGLLAFFGIVSAAFLTLLPAILAQSGQQAALPPHLMHGMLITLGLFYTAIAAVGVWWLVYFNLRSVKAYFLPQYAAPSYPAAYPPAYPAYSPAASLATPGGLVDPGTQYPPPPPPAALPTGRFANVPISLKIIAGFFLSSALVTAVFTFLPFPAFVAGFYLAGIPAHLLYFVYAVWMLLIGIGLLRLSNSARLAVYALTALSFVNSIVMLTPWGRTQFAFYNHQIQQQMHLPPTPPALDVANPVLMTLGLFSALAFYGVILYFIERHRTLFRT